MRLCVTAIADGGSFWDRHITLRIKRRSEVSQSMQVCTACTTDVNWSFSRWQGRQSLVWTHKRLPFSRERALKIKCKFPCLLARFVGDPPHCLCIRLYFTEDLTYIPRYTKRTCGKKKKGKLISSQAGSGTVIQKMILNFPLHKVNTWSVES